MRLHCDKSPYVCEHLGICYAPLPLLVVNKPQYAPQWAVTAATALVGVVGEALGGRALVYEDYAPRPVRREAALRAATSLHASLQAPQPTLDGAHVLYSLSCPWLRLPPRPALSGPAPFGNSLPRCPPPGLGLGDVLQGAGPPRLPEGLRVLLLLALPTLRFPTMRTFQRRL